MKTVWDLSALYSGPDDPRIEADMQKAEAAVAAFAAKWEPRTAEFDQPLVLCEALDDYEALNRHVGTGDRPEYFLDLSCAIDQDNPELKGRAIVIGERTAQMSNQLTFFRLAIGQIPQAAQQRLLEADQLAPYRVVLQRQFERTPHDLSVETTNALNLITPQARDNWKDMVAALLSQETAQVFDGSEVSSLPFSALSGLLDSPNPRVVAEAGAAMTDIMRSLAPIAERELNAVVTTNLRLSEIRKYDRPDAGRFLRDDLDADVVEAMLHAVEGQFALSHRFHTLKAQLLSREGFAYHERLMPYGNLPSGYSFEQAAELLRGVLEPLHPDFARAFDQALAEGRIDALPRTGKRGGAVCWYSLIEYPSYLLLNFMGQIGDVQDLGHEFGHMLNNLYMQEAGLCNSLTFGTTTPMAEVASTFFEKYVLDAAARDTDDETRLALLVSSLGDETGTIFRQTAAMRFEQELYASIGAEGYLSHERIGQLFRKHMSAYLGDTVSMDDGADLWWLYWSHFRSDFYNYSYSFALMVANALQAKLAADPNYIVEFLRFLSTGRARKSRDLLESMGLDVAGPDVWQASLNGYATKLDEVEALARRLGKL